MLKHPPQQLVLKSEKYFIKLVGHRGRHLTSKRKQEGRSNDDYSVIGGRAHMPIPPVGAYDLYPPKPGFCKALPCA